MGVATVALMAVGTVSSSGDTGALGFTLPTVFRDVSGSNSLAVQLDTTRADIGAFTFRVYGMGYVTGVVPIQADGAVDTLHGTVNSELYDESGAAVRSVQMKMDGQAAPSDGSASVNIWIDSQHYHLGTAHGDLNDGQVAASQALASLVSEDWNSLYYMLASDIQVQYTVAQFVEAMTSQAGPKVISASTVPPGTISSINGISYLIVPYTAQLKNADGSTAVINESIYMVLDGGSWRFITTGPSHLN